MAKVGRPSFRPRMKTGRSLAKSSSSKSRFPDKAWYGDDWQTLATYVKQRDNYTCRAAVIGLSPCSGRFPPPFSSLLHAHHIIPLPKGPNHPKNIITLCVNCHNKTHKRQISKPITDKQRQAARRFL